MKNKTVIILALAVLSINFSCSKKESGDLNIVFLHHSTGQTFWKGRTPSIKEKILNRLHGGMRQERKEKGLLPDLFEAYNAEQGTNYNIDEQIFPKAAPYGWNNFPYDYYNIWVKNGGEEAYMEEPTLEMLSKDYNVIIFKHCYPVSYIQADRDIADINSDMKTIANYKLQYAALKEKLLQFPNTKFILFTGASQVEANIDKDKAERAREFFSWVRNDWDQPGDNIHLWDLYELQTEGGLYLKNEYAVSPTNSHPNSSFADSSARLLFNRIIDVVENNGTATNLKGEEQ